MICYIESISDKCLKVCSPEKFGELTHDKRTSVLIDAFRSGKNPGAKSQLPAFVFMGHVDEQLMGKPGSRKKTAMKPTGLFLMDFDHVDEQGTSAREVYDKFLKLMPKLGLTLEHDLALAHITPSGAGLRLVLRSRKNRKVAEDQKWIADALKMECDVHVKDLSRLSFAPKAEDILYMNQTLLFQPLRKEAEKVEERVKVAETSTAEASTAEVKAEVVAVEEAAEAAVAASEETAVAEASVAEVKAEASGFPAEFKGVPYQKIVKVLTDLYGGEPDMGNRHAMIIDLALDLRKICDNDVRWLESLIPDFGKGAEERHEAIQWAVEQKPSRINGNLKKCLEMVGALPANGEERSTGNVDEAMRKLREAQPPALPKKLPQLVSLLTEKVHEHQKSAVAVMAFPALGVHVNNCKFKTRENTDIELSLMSCLLAPQSAGKGCVKPPLRMIMADIKAEDKINRQRERDWQESQKNKKANEKGKSKPDDIVIRCLSSDTTPAAFLGRLQAAEKGDGMNPNLCTYSQVDEIEDLYRFCSGGGKNYINQMIKRSWDRDDIGAERWSANSANISTVLRWNWAASSTIDGGKSFFRRCLTDGTTSRVDFCTIITPEESIEFRYGDYDAAFRERLRPYIDRLKSFSCEKDEDGEVVPKVFPNILELEERMNRYIDETGATMPDSTWVNYAWRTKEMAIKKLIILYIANGCEWEDTFEDFTWWSFNYSMWCKMNLFYDAASAAFQDERLQGDKGHKSPLKFMSRTFTFNEFATMCQQQGLKLKPDAILRKYKFRGVVIFNEDKTYTVTANYAKKCFKGKYSLNSSCTCVEADSPVLRAVLL